MKIKGILLTKSHCLCLNNNNNNDLGLITYICWFWYSVYAHKTNFYCFIEEPVPSQESDPSCILIC